MLECPRCGGSVAATNHACEYCRADLLVKACPRCFAKIFHGASHCSHCGTSVVLPAAADPDGNAVTRTCPRCQDQPMEARLVADVLLDECQRCHGVFVDVDALERVLSERRQVRADAILGALGTLADGKAPPQAQAQQGPLYIRCPVCQNVMNRRSFAQGSKVIVDVCRAHGTWFDVDEMPKVIEFTMKGGLEKAERQRFEEERERHERDKEAARQAAVWAATAQENERRSSSDGLSITGLFEAIQTLISRKGGD